ncbi:MAG: AAA family ATPase [Desulfobacteraceae bacterium]|nr:AAA family ATPase [Desulfobacteraceae bacterium]
MYTTFLGFREKPFNLTPDPRYLFLSPYHNEALEHLLYGINERKGFIAITGGIGTGKTTLCRALLSHLDASTKTALIFNSSISDRELLETIIQEFGLEVDHASVGTKKYIDALNNFLLKNFSQGGNAVLLIDEAQNLSPRALEQIRLLSNLETEREKLIQIVLVGQSELKEVLATPSLQQLDERIMVRYELRPLDRNDIKGYVEHRVGVGGGGGIVRFRPGAYKEIHEYSRGNPRRINSVCDRALLIAYVKEVHTISKKMVREAIGDFRRDRMIDPLLIGRSRRGIDLVTVFLVLLILLAGLTGWSFRNHFASLLSDEQRFAAVIPKFSSPVPPRPKTEAAELFVDEKTSFAGLYDLFNASTRGDGHDLSKGGHVGLVFFTVEPEYYVMFKKPFRVLLPTSLPISTVLPPYLLVRKVTEQGAIVLDASGKERWVTRDFILRHWGRKVSWFYPSLSGHLRSERGMSVAEVFQVQKVLNEIGYLLKPTGVYDEATTHQVARFQKDFGLMADGIVGPRTASLLYQLDEGTP